jgi:cytochrome bd-type quinol oxidase subunit 2
VNLNSVPKDSVITGVQTNSITISNLATVSDTVLTVYEAPWLPIIAILTYVILALASVMQTRYQEAWSFAMSLFVAHYCTLYLRSESGPNLTASQVASSGLTKGVIVSRSAGDVSASSQLTLGDYELWGAWQETQYGEQFITIARAINCGPIFVQ